MVANEGCVETVPIVYIISKEILNIFIYCWKAVTTDNYSHLQYGNN